MKEHLYLEFKKELIENCANCRPVLTALDDLYARIGDGASEGKKDRFDKWISKLKEAKKA